MFCGSLLGKNCFNELTLLVLIIISLSSNGVHTFPHPSQNTAAETRAFEVTQTYLLLHKANFHSAFVHFPLLCTRLF